ncbi:hypothetical protein B0H19DRAFT_1385060 [Mycena capillaripes]|nr:hypothetical protein B0H19DRAFT_1385060 [Mycena capillaripes]
MRKRWKSGRDGAEVHAAPPSRAQQASPPTGKGKGKARAVDEAIEVNIDGIETPGANPSFLLAARAAAADALYGPIAERQLRPPQPHVPVSGRGPSYAPDLQARKQEEEQKMAAYEVTSAAADSGASSSDARTLPPAALDPCPHVRFVERVVVRRARIRKMRSCQPPPVEPARDIEMTDAVPLAEAPPAAGCLHK